MVMKYFRFLQAAEMLKPSKPSSGHEGNITEDSQDYFPNIGEKNVINSDKIFPENL